MEEVRRKKGRMAMANYKKAYDEIIVLKEKVAALEAWRCSTELDLKELADAAASVGVPPGFGGNRHQRRAAASRARRRG
jgi:hypothetical protein